MFAGATSRPAATRGGRIVLVALTLLATGLVGAAHGSVLLRWRPSSDPTIVGYDLYARAAGQAYPAPLRVGRPSLATDGTHSFQLTSLPSAPTLYFAVAGYRADGNESGLSNEVPVGPTDPCVVDRCYAPESCVSFAAPDGSRCAGASADPCASVCGNNVCGAATRADLTTRRLALVQATHGVRLGATAVILPVAVTDIAATGMSLAVEGTDGTSIFEATVPGNAFSGNAIGTTFRYRAPRGTTTGLLRLSIRRAGDQYRLSARAILPGTTTDAMPGQLRWMVNIGAECAGDGSPACTQSAGSISCS